MNPYKLSQVYKQLTSQNSILKKYLKLGTKDIKQPDLPAFVEKKNAVNRFMRDNPRPDQLGRKDMAGGGMLVKPSADGSRPGYKGKATDKADELLKAYSEEGANSPIKREIKKKILTNPAFKKFTGDENLKKLSKLTSTEKGYTERNLINNFLTHRRRLNLLPNKGEGYITAMNLADMLNIPENTFWNNLDSIKKDYPQYNLNKINSILSPEKITVKGNNFIYYKTPSKKQIKELKKFFDRPILNKNTVTALNAFFNDENIMKMLNDRKFPSIEEAQAVLKKAKLPSSESNTATAMLRLGEVLQGKEFKNNINIKANKVLGNYVVKQLENFDMYHPWSRGIYDAAVREITENVPTQVGSIEKYKTLLKNRLPKNFLEKNNINLNEIFSIKASARNKAYPYAYFIDAIDKDINTKDLKNFHGNLSKAQDKLISAIDELKKAGSPQERKIAYKKAEDIVAKFQKTRKAHKNTILKNHGNKPFNLPNLVLGKEKQILNEDIKIAESVYKKSNLDNWASQGIDIAQHAQKSGYVMTGADAPKAILATEIATADEKQFKNILAKIGCPGFQAADGGRATFDVGTNCQMKGANLINSGMKNASPAQLKNFAAFANRARALGRGVMKFGIIPEAMYVAADATIRLTMGDKPTEALLRASEYLLPGDQTKLAEMMEATRLMNPETAAIIGRSIDYKNQLAKIDSLTSQRDNLENLSGGGEFDYIGNLNQDVSNLNNQIKQATDALNTKFKMTDAEQTYADAMQAEVDDIRKSGSFLTKTKAALSGIGENLSDVETIGRADQTQEQLNKRMADQLPRDLLLAPESELIDYAKYQQSQGFDIPDDYYIQQQQAVKNMSLAELAAATSPEQVYGAQGYIAEPLNKGVVEKPQNVISDMEREITGQTNVANPFDIDLSMIGSGLRGFAAAKGGRAGFESGTIPGGYTDDAYAYLREIDDEIFNSFKKYKAGGGKMKYGQYAYNAKRQMFGPFGVGVGRLKRAGGGISKQAGVDSGPPPESGPNPQGLSYLMKRGKNI